MASGYLLPASRAFASNAAGNLSPGIYIPATNTNAAGQIEKTLVTASLAADATEILQFICSNPLPSGTLKLRSLLSANATSGVVKFTVKDGKTAPGANIGAATLTTETQQSITWTTADVEVENKLTLAAAPAAGDVITVVITYNTTGWTLAAILAALHMLVWE
jgi:hypothetical protein